MKLPEFDSKHKQWDMYNAFYCRPANDFVQFETGELIYIRRAPDPDQRIHYPQFNLSLWATGDGGRKFTTPDGEDIPNTWLHKEGIQYLMIDHDSKQAVGLNWGRTWHNANDVPKNLRGATAYFLCPGGAIHGAPIRVLRPVKSTEVNIKPWAEEVQSAALAVCRMTPELANNRYLHTNKPYYITPSTLSVSPSEYLAAIDLTTYDGKKQISAMAHWGIALAPEKTLYPFLLVKE